MELRVYSELEKIPQAQWDALIVGGLDAPFLRWHWLGALEASGSATPEAGWQPCHLTLWDGERLVGAAPAYLKLDSDGDFSRDFGWVDAAMRAGAPYYPKLVVGVPFTPCTGPRLLVLPGEDPAPVRAALAEGLDVLARDLEARSLHVLFPSEAEAAALEPLGLFTRVSFQYHWRNEGYTDPEAFLACLSSKKRNQARRERAAPAHQGIAIRTVRGAELAEGAGRWAGLMYTLHSHTVDQMMWGRRWLNRAFYERVFAAMPEALEVVVAEREGRVVAGAFNVASRTRLYGRYWGCLEAHPFLHFNVCLYHSIDDCIARGLEVFEGGAGGEHKIARGFEPALTFSSHRFLDRRLDRAFRDHAAREALERRAALERWRREAPIIKRKPTGTTEEQRT